MDLTLIKFGLLLALSFFFGLAFEDFYGRDKSLQPGGIRSFPLLALTGALLFEFDIRNLVPFSVGLFILGGWLTVYYWHRLTNADKEGSLSLIVPVCNILAYLLGPAAIICPTWVATAITVSAVLLLTARERLHGLAERIELHEIVTASKFIILTGLIMPLLPNEPVTHLTKITPHQVWLAVLVICSISYASYLTQRYIAPSTGGWWTALLGGLYSSTATTVVLARRATTDPSSLNQAQNGIILATAVMYIRILVIVAVFNNSLAIKLAPSMLLLSAIGFSMAALGHHYHSKTTQHSQSSTDVQANPLELTTALIFALLFVGISLASSWIKIHYGTTGIYTLAGIVGVTDIDPFVLSLAQGDATAIPVTIAAIAIIIATSSNNLLKATYTIVFLGKQKSFFPATSLVILALLSLTIIGAQIIGTPL